MRISTWLSGAVVALPCCLWTVSAAHAAEAGCQPSRAAERYPTLADKTLRIGADPQTPPYVMRDGTDMTRVVGVDADLARAVFECIGLKHEFVLGAWSGLLPAVQSGQIDAMWDDLYYKPERARVLGFAVYMVGATGGLVPSGNPHRVTSVDGLCGLTVSYAVGSSNEVATKRQSEACVAKGRPAVATMPFQDLAAGLRLLDSGRADLIMWDLGFVDNLVSNQPSKYARAFSVMDGYEIGVGVAKDNTALLNALRDGLSAVQANGGMEAILRRYGVDAALSLPVALRAE